MEGKHTYWAILKLGIAKVDAVGCRQGFGGE
jgi:hypothetical protein